MITKIKNDKTKRRLILDCRRSGISGGSKLGQRINLPRLNHPTKDITEPMAGDDGDDVEVFIIDFTDAFWHNPLRHDERRYYTRKYSDKFLVVLMLAQGSVNALLVRCRFAALATRMAQSLDKPHRLCLHTYVDDPAAALKGPKPLRDRIIVKIILVWMVCSVRFQFGLAFAKAARGADLEWIGARRQLFRHHLHVSAKTEALEELLQTTNKFFNTEVISAKALGQYTGQANHIAGIVMQWRPFLNELWAAIAYADDPESFKPARSCVWARQVRHTLLWLHAFLAEKNGSLARKYFAVGKTNITSVWVTVDASPWVLGGFSTINGMIDAYFSCPLDAYDEHAFQRQVGDAAGQQTWECLATLTLIALRLWGQSWKVRGCVLHVRADNVTTLTLVLKMKASTRAPGITRIALELSLDLGDCSYYPQVLEHTPGVANKLADTLSRM